MFDDGWWLLLAPLALVFWWLAGRPGWPRARARRRRRAAPQTEVSSTQVRAERAPAFSVTQTQPVSADPAGSEPAAGPAEAALDAERTLRDAYAAAEAEAERRAAERRVAEEAEATRLAAARRRAEDEAAAREAAAAAARAEAERQAEATRVEAERKAAERSARIEAEYRAAQAARLEAERQAAEQAAAERARREAERAAAEQARREAERAAAEQARREGERAAAAERTAAAARAARPARTPEATLVMVVDDSKVVRVKTSRLLAAQRYRFALAEDGEAALRLLATEPPQVLITDVEMPGVDGFELTRRVRASAATAQLPIIMITSADDRLQQAAREAGVTVLLGKPYPEDVLMGHIARLAGVAAPQAATA